MRWSLNGYNFKGFGDSDRILYRLNHGAVFVAEIHRFLDLFRFEVPTGNDKVKVNLFHPPRVRISPGDLGANLQIVDLHPLFAQYLSQHTAAAASDRGGHQLIGPKAPVLVSGDFQLTVIESRLEPVFSHGEGCRIFHGSCAPSVFVWRCPAFPGGMNRLTTSSARRGVEVLCRNSSHLSKAGAGRLFGEAVNEQTHMGCPNPTFMFLANIQAAEIL